MACKKNVREHVELRIEFEPKGDIKVEMAHPTLHGAEFERVWPRAEWRVRTDRGIEDCAGPISVSMERRMASAREGMHFVLDQLRTISFLSESKDAYDAGIASGFYGKHSAIAAGFRRNIAYVLCAMRSVDSRSPGIRQLKEIVDLGRRHGELIRNPI